MIEVAKLTPASVGLLGWPSPDTTLIVKTAVSLEDQSLVPEPLARDRAAAGGEAGELELASDFVPRKARADVIVVGHAHSPMASVELPIRLRIGDVDKRAFALSAAPALHVPLLSTYLRHDPSRPIATRVGPRRPRFGFNVAPLDQQLDALHAGARLRLDGLLPWTPRWEGSLPAEEPRVFLVSRGIVHDIVLLCDTLCIDADRGIATLTWRGDLAPVSADAVIVVTTARSGEPSDWYTTFNRLGEAIWTHAEQAHDDITAEIALRRDTTTLFGALPFIPGTTPTRGSIPELSQSGFTLAASGSLFDIDPLPFRASTQGERSLDDYVALRIAIEKMQSAVDALAANEVSFAEWRDLHHHWRERAIADPSIAQRLRERLAEARSRE